MPVSRSQYLDKIDELKRDQTPVTLWVYLGLRTSDQGNSLYTYGLTEFGKQEIEIINSALSLEELYNFAANIAPYVVGSDAILKSGQALGYTEDQKKKLRLPKACLLMDNL